MALVLPPSKLASTSETDIAELTSQIKTTLQAQGQLQAIRAQLRACVYGALAGKAAQQQPKPTATTPEARLALALIGQFLEHH
eukprot:2778859-Prymnesium_polylepis.1